MKAKTYSEMKLQYKKLLEVGLIVSLLFHVVLFQGSKRFVVGEQILKMDTSILTSLDVPQTMQQQKKVEISLPTVPIVGVVDELPNLDLGEIFRPRIPEVANMTAPACNDEEDPFMFVAVEQYPEPIGGVAAIQTKVKYPKLAIQAGIEGRVIIRAKIDEEGNVVKMLVQNSMEFEPCEKEAMDAIQSVKFTPAMQRDEPVSVWMSIPVDFKLK